MTDTTRSPELERTLTLRGAVTLNLLDMIGVGPFLTLPLLLAAMGGPQAMLGWVLGALLAACDGLVWAELGAAMPEAGGTYHYLATIFPGKFGRWLSFLFVFQLCFSAPLSVASGCIGLAQYAGYLSPALVSHAAVHALHLGPYSFGVTFGVSSWLAVAAVAVAVVLLYRKLSEMRALGAGLLALVLLTIGWAIVTGLLHGHIGKAFAFAPGAFRLNHAFFAGLGSAMLIATYDYWGYYNVTFLGGETREPGRTIPRAVLISIGIVSLLYLALNTSVLAVLGSSATIAAGGTLDARRALLSQFMQTAYAPSLGAHTALWLGRTAAVLVMVTAFASVFSLLLGYSRIPFAAARDGNFPAIFGKLHPTRGFPYLSLLTLAAAACVFCFFALADVIAALVVLRIVLQFSLQHVGVIVLRIRRPDLPRPFRLWLYPVPPLLALAGFGYIVFSRPNFHRELLLAAVVALAGSMLFVLSTLARGNFPSKRASDSVL
ncbi:APC family permease [Granulicella paludicola]|uniref:APC family permease n=1 Tax=Granulicella paludicola TaxID=474951 RepID=UPI0021DFD5F7|nr:APC family permease [Granulicella paludicola]